MIFPTSGLSVMLSPEFYVIEPQRRGLPRAHNICILSDADAPRPTDSNNDDATAVLPDTEGSPALRYAVTPSMMHGPFGATNPRSARMVDGVFAKGHPKRFRPETIAVGGFPEYRRPVGGRYVLENGVLLTNDWVAPHNPWLCAEHSAHINVDVCSPADAVKYLYKYVYRGADRAAVEVGTEEIHRYLDGMYLDAQEY